MIGRIFLIRVQVCGGKNMQLTKVLKIMKSIFGTLNIVFTQRNVKNANFYICSLYVVCQENRSDWIEHPVYLSQFALFWKASFLAYWGLINTLKNDIM